MTEQIKGQLLLQPWLTFVKGHTFLWCFLQTVHRLAILLSWAAIILVRCVVGLDAFWDQISSDIISHHERMNKSQVNVSWQPINYSQKSCKSYSICIYSAPMKADSQVMWNQIYLFRWWCAIQNDINNRKPASQLSDRLICPRLSPKPFCRKLTVDNNCLNNIQLWATVSNGLLQWLEYPIRALWLKLLFLC